MCISDERLSRQVKEAGPRDKERPSLRTPPRKEQGRAPERVRTASPGSGRMNTGVMWGRRRGDAAGVTTGVTALLLEKSQGASRKDNLLGPMLLAAVLG
ncbi:unnamed protein product [Boreogadus saida]